MSGTLHITSGDIAGGRLAKSGIEGEVFVWHDILYDGPRKPGWPDDAALNERARFLEEFTGGGLERAHVLGVLKTQYGKIEGSALYDRIVLWFDGCLFDQSMLVHVLTCLNIRGARNVDLICAGSYPGIEPFHGLGQLRPDQFASLLDTLHRVSDEEFSFAALVDRAFVEQDEGLLSDLSKMTGTPLPFVPAAVARWMEEKPSPETGLGKLETLALAAMRSGCETPEEIFRFVAAADAPPQFWGDTTLWAKINGLSLRVPPLVRIEGPAVRLPQWESKTPLSEFRVRALV